MEQGTRDQLVETYKEGTRVFAEALEGIADGELDARPGPEEWTAREVVHHMADSEMTSAIRLRRLIAEDAPTMAATTKRRYAQRLFHDERRSRRRSRRSPRRVGRRPRSSTVSTRHSGLGVGRTRRAARTA